MALLKKFEYNVEQSTLFVVFQGIQGNDITVPVDISVIMTDISGVQNEFTAVLAYAQSQADNYQYDLTAEQKQALLDEQQKKIDDATAAISDIQKIETKDDGGGLVADGIAEEVKPG